MVKKSNIKNKLKELKERTWHKAHYILMSPVRIFKFICFATGLFTLTILLFLGLVTLNFYNGLPNIKKMSKSDLKKIAINRVVKKLGTKKKIVKYKWTPLDKVNRDLLYTIVMSEDSKFFQHSGVDYNSLLDTIAYNIKKRDVTSGGASTISQQVVKNLFLHGGKTFTRKLEEYFITKRLESRFTKNDILEIYLNIAEFGIDIFGVEHASLDMFGKKASKVNVAEGAYLALMLPSPRKNYYIIHQNKNLTNEKKRKVKRILKDMAYHQFISYKQYLKYLKYDYSKLK